MFCIDYVCAFTAVCVCVRSSAVDLVTSVSNTPLMNILVPSFRYTTTIKDDARLYVAIDSDDYYWHRFIKVIESVGTVVIVNKTLLDGRIPFNEITQRAQDDGAEYIVRVNEDTEFVTPGWVQIGKDELSKMDPPNVGVVVDTRDIYNLVQMLPCAEKKTQYRRFLRYESCEWEKKWISNIKEWGDLDAGTYHNLIKKSSEELQNEKDVIAGIALMMQTNTTQLPNLPRNKEIFSRFIYEVRELGEEPREEVYLIEPLTQLLRAYGVTQQDSRNLLSRNYILLADRPALKPLTHGSTNFYIDLGASTWNSGAGGPSQNWFFKTYEKRGLQIDRALLWEVTKKDMPKVFAEVPSKYLHAYQYFNIPAKSGKYDLDNPLNMLKKMVKRFDFVSLKIDIDTPSIENPLIQQLLDDVENYAPIVNEFFFEHHVRNPTMLKWWKTKVSGTLADSYALHLKLRKHGIRSHGWP